MLRSTHNSFVSSLPLLALACGLALTSPAPARGAISFGSPTTYVIGSGITSLNGVAAGDFDGDGRTDLIAIGFPSAFSFLKGNGDGSFQPAITYSLLSLSGATPGPSTVGDFNLDGHLDIIIGHPSSSGFPNGFGNKITVHLGQGNGIFGPQSVFATGGSNTGLDSGDLNGDGKRDIVVGSQDSSGIFIYFGDGLGGFGPPTFHNTGAPTFGGKGARVRVVDANGDSNLDILASNQSDQSVSVFLNAGNGSYGTPTLNGVLGGGGAVVPSDLNQDGSMDIAVTHGGSNSNLTALFGDGTGGFLFSQHYAAGGAPGDAAGADFDGDGLLDVLTVNQNTNSMSVFPADGLGGFLPRLDVSIGISPSAVAVADFDGDGAPDMAVSNAGQGSVSVALNTTAPADLVPPVISAVNADPNPVAINAGIILTARADDSAAGGSNITSGVYALDGGSTFPMSASDGAFDEISEDMTAAIGPLTVPAIHEICVQATDEADNLSAPSCVLLPVYDPQGGFVTGGGWINSPSEADLESGASGTATFGFVSKYKKGLSTPDGNLQFRFTAGDIAFHSTSMEWLVVTGEPRAMFRGEGLVNGETTCKFEVDAWDESYSGEDAFGLKLFACGPAADLNRYALPATVLGGGSIIIHTK